MKAIRHIPIQRHGFSLIELVIVLAIIGTLGAIAAPRFSNMFAQQRVNAGADRVVADLKLVQAQARAMGQSVTVTFNPSNQSYTVTTTGRADRVIDLSEPPYELRIRNTTTFNGTLAVTFNAYGLPDNAGTIGLRLQQGTSVNIAVTVSASGEISHAYDNS